MASRKANGSSVNGLRKRQRVTVQRDEDVRSELLETGKYGDPERLKNEKEQEFAKSSGGDWSCCRENESTDSSGEEYSEGEGDVRVHHPRNRFSSPSSHSVNNHRGFRDLAPSPEQRNCADEILGFSVPRRTRSATTRKFPDIMDTRSGGFREELVQRKHSEHPTMVLSSAMRGDSPAPPLGVSLKKKKYSETKTGFWNCAFDSLANPADIEIEAAEALFDLMRQSYSQTRIREEPEKLDRERICDAHGDEDEASAKAKAGGTSVDSIAAVNKQVVFERDKSLDEGFDGSVRGVELASNREVGSRKESETLSYVEANPRDVRDPPATNANNATDLEAKKGTQHEMDLMDREEVRQEAPSIVLSQLLEENPGYSQQIVREDSKNQLPNAVLPSVGGINNLHGVVSRGGHMPQFQAVYPTDASARFMKLPQFKLSQPQPKRCALHHCIARDIQNHQQLIKSMSLSAPPAGICGSQMLNPKTVSTPQNLVPEDLSLGDSKPHKKPCGPGFTFGQKKLLTSSSAANQTAGATGNASLPSNPAERSMSLPFPRGMSTMNFSHPVFPPSSCYPVPISSNHVLLPFGGVSSTAPPFDPSSCFSVNQIQKNSLPLAVKPPAFQNMGSLSQNQPLSLQQKNLDRRRDASTLGGLSPNLPLGALGDPFSTGKAEPFSSHRFVSPFGTAQNSGIFQLHPDVIQTAANQPPPRRSCKASSDANAAMNSGQILNFSNTGCADLPSAFPVPFPILTEHQKPTRIASILPPAASLQGVGGIQTAALTAATLRSASNPEMDAPPTQKRGSVISILS